MNFLPLHTKASLYMFLSLYVTHQSFFSMKFLSLYIPHQSFFSIIFLSLYTTHQNLSPMNFFFNALTRINSHCPKYKLQMDKSHREPRKLRFQFASCVSGLTNPWLTNLINFMHTYITDPKTYQDFI